MEEFFVRSWEMMTGRADAALSMRFFMQPAVAIIFAMRGALADYDSKKQPLFFWSLFKGEKLRANAMSRIWFEIGGVFLMALSLDLIYQLWAFKWIYPMQTFLVATTFSFVPYILIRGPLSRVLLRINTKSHRFYIVLLVVQTLGVGIIFWTGVPFYRRLLVDPSFFDPKQHTGIWSLCGIVFIQVGYWFRFALCPPMPRFTSPLIGHLVTFSARMSFIFATSIFSFVFIQARLEDKLAFGRNVLALAGVFSLYCYMKELKAFGNALIGVRTNRHVEEIKSEALNRISANR